MPETRHPATQGLALAYLESLRVAAGPYGRFTYAAGIDTPVLYASAYAALTQHLCRRQDHLSDADRKSWVHYLQAHQCDDGLFRQAYLENDLADREDWWGWRHLTVHVLGALAALGATAARPLRVIEPLKRPGAVEQWLAGLDWGERVAFTSNAVQNWGVMLQYARDFQGDREAGQAARELLDGLDARQDPHSGLWGPPAHNPGARSQAVQAAYHFLLLYVHDKRPIPCAEPLIDAALATQNSAGGFGVNSPSTACEDIDSIHPLVRLSRLTDYRAAHVQAALERARHWVLSNQNADGGFVFVRGRVFHYGHELMRSEPDQSAAFPTWFRLLSLAYLAEALPDASAPADGFQFLSCPGYQMPVGEPAR